MRIAYFAESPADQAALTVLTEAVLKKKTVPIIHGGLRSRGWPAVRNVLPAVLKQLHYHTDAEGFVLVVDSNGSAPHSAGHEVSDQTDLKCRLCQLRHIVADVQRQVRPRVNQPALKIALGLAVPAIEAWLLYGVDSRVSEAAWINGLKEKTLPYTALELKRQLYGTSRPSLAIEIEVMERAARRLRENLSAFEAMFPQGFGALVKAIQNWAA